MIATKEDFLIKIKKDLNALIGREKLHIKWSENDGAGLHHSLGQWIRNHWGLWKGGNELTDFFNENGIWHADDMSGIIISSYIKMLKEEEVNLDGQIEYYKKYWKDKKIDIEKETKANIANQ